MLPYTPLHYLLFLDYSRSDSQPDNSHPGFLPLSLVMTSGNLSEEPIATQNPEARQRLAGLADAFLMHNRPIQTRCDDSVVRSFNLQSPSQPVSRDAPTRARSNLVFLRRSRGYAPDPLLLPWDAPHVLAAGAELKNTFCLARDRYAFLSQHIGDMENYETLQSFETSLKDYENIFRIHPQVIAYDLHPNYLATRYALQRAQDEGLPALGVQHHHAHIASCMAENSLAPDQAIIGIALDGTGYGPDEAIWGGEFLFAGYQGYQRYAHLAYMPLPGGDAAIRKPCRIALAYLQASGLEWLPSLPSYQALSAQERHTLQAQLANGLNTPPTSSMGRLFDAVAALIGVRQQVNYEAQAAIEMEALVDPLEKGFYKFGFDDRMPGEGKPHQIEIQPVLSGILEDIRSEIHPRTIAARFHNGIVQLIQDVVLAMRKSYRSDLVALSGGVWQNMVLLHLTVEMLRRQGFHVLIHRQVPANDGGLALGQAAVAAHSFPISRR